MTAPSTGRAAGPASVPPTHPSGTSPVPGAPTGEAPAAEAPAPDVEAPATSPAAVDPAGPPGSPAAAAWTRPQRAALAAVVAFVFGVYTAYAWARHAKYETTGFDLGIFDQVVRAYAHFSEPTSPLKGVDYDILGDHFHPVLAVLAPLYWVWDDPRVLLTVQAALFALSVLPVAAFVRRRFGGRIGVLVALAYGACWPLQGAVHFDFHEIAFAVALIAVLVDAMDTRRYRVVVAACVVLLGVREDMGALVLLAGVLVALRPARTPGERRHALLLGGALAAVGVAGYYLATSVIIPALGPAGFAYWTFTALGPDPVSALRFMITNPWRVAVLMVSPAVKFNTLVAIFTPAGLLTLASPYVLLTLPFLAERMLNDRELLWQTNFHYTSVIAPVLVMGAADTVDRLMRRFPRVLGPRPLRVPTWVPTRASGRSSRQVVVSLALVWALWCVGFTSWGIWTRSVLYPVSGGILSGRVWDRDLRWRSVHETLPMIPPDECVEADNQIAPQLTRRDYVTRVTLSQGLATWVIIDMYQRETGWQTPPPAIALARLQADGYRVVSWRGPIVLLHKDQPVAPVCRGRF